MMRDEYLLLVKDLREKTYGYGAFGEPENYDPPLIQLKAAKAIEDLLDQLDQARSNG